MKRSSKNSVVLSILMSLFFGSQVLAGEIIFFKSGAIDPTEKGFQPFSLAKKNTDKVIVQFTGKLEPKHREMVEALGGVIHRYLPEDAYLITASSSIVEKLQKKREIRAIIPFVAGFKWSTDFSPSSVFNKAQAEVIQILTFSSADTKKVAKAIAKDGGLVLQSAGKGIYAQLTRTQSLKVAQMSEVEWMEPYKKITRFDMNMGVDATGEKGTGDYSDLNGYESGTTAMNLSTAWNAGLFGSSQLVAMADTGLDSGDANAIHADFAGQVASGYAFGMWSDSWSDPNGHGTHVAGSVLGKGTKSDGRLRGAAPGARMVVEGLWSTMMRNLTVPPDLATLFDPAYADGARVHTNSWGSPQNLGAYEAYASQVDEYMWNHPDLLVLFAAGNSGVDSNRDGRIDEGSVSSPGTAKNALTVGASENLVTSGGIQARIGDLSIAKERWPVEPFTSDYLSNNPNGIACFSSRGPTLDGRLKPEIVAPGTNILSAFSQVTGASEMWGLYNEHYAFSGGTSMATPLTAGAAALTREFLMSARGHKNPSGALVKATLIHTAYDLFPGQFGFGSPTQELMKKRPNVHEGYGRVDMAKLVTLGEESQIIDQAKGVAQGMSHQYTITAEQGGLLIATLVYNDAPASPNVSKTLVNDLDLVLVSATGERVSLNDRVNNYEMLELQLEPGTYTLQVEGTSIPQGRDGSLPYALIYSVY